MTELWDKVKVTDGSVVLEEAQSALDERISSLEAAVISLKSRRNELSLVHRLPPEALSKVFMCLVEMSPYVPMRKQLRKARPAWIPVSHVSRHWRSIALDCAPLWATITAQYGAQWISEMMVRAQGAPLSLHTAGLFGHLAEGVYSQALYEAASLHNSQIQTLTIDTSRGRLPARVDNDLWIKLIPSLVSLRSLSLAGYTRSQLNVLAQANNLSKLRSLSLTLSFIQKPFPSEVLHQLRSLTLIGKDSHTSHTYTPLDDILAILERSSQLRTLRILQVAIGRSQQIPAVKLVYLENLHLQNAASVCGTLMSHLTIPQKANVSVLVSGATMHRNGMQAYSNLVDALGKHIEHRTLHTKALVKNGYITWTAQTSERSPLCMWIKLGEVPRDTMRLWPVPGVAGWLPVFQGHLPVDCLTLSGDAGLKVLQTLRTSEVSSSLPNLRELVLHNMSYGTSHNDILLWLIEREKHGLSAPTRITVASNPLDVLAEQIRRMSGDDGFSLYCGDQLVKSGGGQ